MRKIPSPTMAILVATALHAIATGNMLPAFVTEADGSLRELTGVDVASILSNTAEAKG